MELSVGYQTFPWQSGDSHSFGKLLALYLPGLKGKTVLDVGCNTGFFCGWAAFQQAARVKGVDRDLASIKEAENWFPDCSFACRNWEDLSQEKFDVILCLSAIHYSKDQQMLIDKLMDRLNPEGVLVLELGVAAGSEDAFVKVKRSIDTRYFPTNKKVQSLLAGYSWKYIGNSVPQEGDPVDRHVYHVYHTRPRAILFLDRHYTGKTRTAEAIINKDIPRVSGDGVYYRIAKGALAAPEALQKQIAYVPGTEHIDSAAVTRSICEAGYVAELAAVFAGLGEARDFIVDTYIPEAYREEFAESLEQAGFFVVEVSLHAARKTHWTRQRPPYAQYQAFIKHLDKLCAIDEDAYLAANPDVARAVAAGKVPSARHHYWSFGRREKRRLR